MALAFIRFDLNGIYFALAWNQADRVNLVDQRHGKISLHGKRFSVISSSKLCSVNHMVPFIVIHSVFVFLPSYGSVYQEVNGIEFESKFLLISGSV